MLEHEWDRRSVQFPLTAESVVLDIGGYKGRWAKEIASRYGCTIYVFEPQAWAADIARAELAEFPNVKVLNFGLGMESGVFEMEEYETDGATFMLGRSQRQQSGEGPLVEFSQWLSDANINNIDLVMMNIEGYEFKLIPYMLENDILPGKIKYFMVQFHPLGYDQEDEYTELRKKIGEVMDVHFDYGIVLMCWKGKAEGRRQKADSVDATVYAAQNSQPSNIPSAIPVFVPESEKPKRKGGRKKKAVE